MRSLLFFFFVVFISVLLHWVVHSSVTVTVPHLFFMIAVRNSPFVFCLGIPTLCSHRMCVWLENATRTSSKKQPHIHSHQYFTKSFFFTLGSEVTCSGYARTSSPAFLLFFFFFSVFFPLLNKTVWVHWNNNHPQLMQPFHLWISRLKNNEGIKETSVRTY